MERFSPLYNESASFGFSDMRPERSYEYIYPANVDLKRASYFFEGHSPDTIADSFMDDTRAAVERWRSKWRVDDSLPFLTYLRTHAGIHISDGRESPADPVNAFYRSPGDAIYLYCSDQPRPLHSIARDLRECHGMDLDEVDLKRILDRFLSRGFMLMEDNLYLSLGLPAYRRA